MVSTIHIMICKTGTVPAIMLITVKIEDPVVNHSN